MGNARAAACIPRQNRTHDHGFNQSVVILLELPAVHVLVSSGPVAIGGVKGQAKESSEGGYC